jgi:ankyrin repeat protein
MRKQFVIRHGVSMATEGDAVHLATRRAHAATVQLLLGKGADIDGNDNDGWTALHFATDWGSEAAVWLLLEKRARILAKDASGTTALHLAAGGGYHAARLLVEKGTSININHGRGRIALHLAVANGHEAVARLWAGRQQGQIGPSVRGSPDRGEAVGWWFGRHHQKPMPQ